MYHGGIINGVAQGGKIVLRRVYTVHYIEQKDCTTRFAINLTDIVPGGTVQGWASPVLLPP